MSDAREGRHDYVACFIRKNTALAIILLFTSGATVGWIGRGFRDNDWRISPEPTRWHSVTLLDVIDERILLVKLDGHPMEIVPVCDLADGAEEIGQRIPLARQLDDATAVMLDFGTHLLIHKAVCSVEFDCMADE